jgi:hypothetical protein
MAAAVPTAVRILGRITVICVIGTSAIAIMAIVERREEKTIRSGKIIPEILRKSAARKKIIIP